MRCKIGDECFVISTSNAHSDCLGRIVEVVGVNPVKDVNGNHWVIEFVHARPPSLYKAQNVVAPDHCLLPIRAGGLTDTSQLSKKEPQHV